MIEVAHPNWWATSILEGFVTVYLGSLGRMIPIYSTPSAQLETEERYSFSTTLEGRRKAQARPIGRRTWGLNAQFADPREHSLLSQFANGAWGPGPFVFVSADAPYSNMLTPSVASCDPAENFRTDVTNGGPVLVDGEWEPRSYATADGSTPIFFGATRTPVIPGTTVTGSAYVLGVGSAKVLLNWYDIAGAFISTTAGQAVTSGQMKRSIATAVVPSNAHGCVLSTSGAIQATRPALTWGDKVYAWSSGQGCAKAVVHGASSNLVLTGRTQTYSNLSFTVTEVG